MQISAAVIHPRISLFLRAALSGVIAQPSQHLSGARVIRIELEDTFDVLPRLVLLTGGAEGLGKVHPNSVRYGTLWKACCHNRTACCRSPVLASNMPRLVAAVLALGRACKACWYKSRASL